MSKEEESLFEFMREILSPPMRMWSFEYANGQCVGVLYATKSLFIYTN